MRIPLEIPQLGKVILLPAGHIRNFEELVAVLGDCRTTCLTGRDVGSLRHMNLDDLLNAMCGTHPDRWIKGWRTQMPIDEHEGVIPSWSLDQLASNKYQISDVRSAKDPSWRSEGDDQGIKGAL